MKNWEDNVFDGIPVGREEASLFGQFVSDHDFSAHTRKAYNQDVRKFAGWFSSANREPFVVGRVTTRDVSDFRDHLRRQQGQAVATVNRSLVAVRKFFEWLVERGHVAANPAKRVKELHKVALAPKGMERNEVRRLLRELELRGDVRAMAIFSVMLYGGLRVADVAGLELHDLMLNDRSGSLVLRNGKGNKQRSVPLPLPARQALERYLETRPPIASDRLFVGERGPLTERGIRALCDKYSVLTGVRLHPHLLRHTMAHQFLDANPGDLVSLSQILGHESLNTTARYTQRTEGQLGAASERMSY
jgi:integrase/recombinase XerC